MYAGGHDKNTRATIIGSRRETTEGAWTVSAAASAVAGTGTMWRSVVWDEVYDVLRSIFSLIWGGDMGYLVMNVASQVQSEASIDPSPGPSV